MMKEKNEYSKEKFWLIAKYLDFIVFSNSVTFNNCAALDKINN